MIPLHVHSCWRQKLVSADIFLTFLTNIFLLKIRLLTRMVEQGDQGEVYWVNKLIEIEHLDWSKQLEKAVHGFRLVGPLYPCPLHLPTY